MEERVNVSRTILIDGRNFADLITTNGFIRTPCAPTTMDGRERGADETVYLVPRRQCYHTDADCYQLDRAHAVYEKPRQIVPDHMTECRICSDACNVSKNGDTRTVMRKLEALDPNEI